MALGTWYILNYLVEELMNESIKNASVRVGDWNRPTSAWQVSICVWEGAADNSQECRQLQQVQTTPHLSVSQADLDWSQGCTTFQMHIFGTSVNQYPSLHPRVASHILSGTLLWRWMERVGKSILERIDFFFSSSLSHEEKQMNTGAYGGALHPFAGSLIYQDEGMLESRQTQVQVLTLPLTSSVTLLYPLCKAPFWQL